MKRPWMPLYIADYRAKTTRLSAAQHGAYLLLIMDYWTNGFLPKDDASLARIASMTAAEWKRNRPIIAAFFDSEWRHSRIDDELASAAAISNKRSAAASQRHDKNHAIAHANGSANGMQLHTHFTLHKEDSLSSEGKQPAGFQIRQDSPEADAWRKYRRKGLAFGRRGVLTMPTQWPPDHEQSEAPQ